MPAAFVFTPRALEDLDYIWTYIARENLSAADRVQEAILAAAARLARHPHLGSRRTDITDRPVRFWILPRFPNFVLVYRPETQPLQVVAVLHNKRNLPSLL
ncbi:MAG TPA: type II toxin-antitoxin system RelE/ParE family toxin [Terracidiphilus sp.]|jgi:plasmid stabilization system protein ParE|nr:type II toxin-antitoxin system RelE/ParE family toxin [Terracidiphilus sp.]